MLNPSGQCFMDGNVEACGPDCTVVAELPTSLIETFQVTSLLPVRTEEVFQGLHRHPVSFQLCRMFNTFLV